MNAGRTEFFLTCRVPFATRSMAPGRHALRTRVMQFALGYEF
jgi:hypothetical protein